MIVIDVQNIFKSYQKLTAVNDLSFKVSASTCFGLLGPNGAGKTTMMKMIYGTADRDKLKQSRINIFGFDPQQDELKIKILAGVVPQENNLDEELNVYSNLLVYSKFYNLPTKTARERINYLLKFMELSDKQKSLIRELSGGMKRRLVIARALLNNPQLLILDEPTTGLDPQVRHLIWDKLRQLKKQGTTILLTTHYMEEAYQICDKIIIMDKGQKIMEGAPKILLKKEIETYVLEIPKTGIKMIGKKIPANIRMDESHHITLFYSYDYNRLKKWAVQNQFKDYYLRPSNLEDLFLKATGRELNEKQ